MRSCFFTSIALNYLDKALALADSVFKIYPQTSFVIAVIDYGMLPAEVQQGLDQLSRDFTTQGHKLEFLDPLTLLEQPKLFKFKFNVVEACTSVKPAVSLNLLQRFPDITYLDPDTILYAPLPADPHLAEDWNFQVTPHVIAPAVRPGLVSERLFMFYGVFNLGYFAAKATAQSIAFLQWWHRFCMEYGADAPMAGLFVDQKPVDLLPSFVDRLSVLRHPGCNAAWWNIFCDGRRPVGNGHAFEFQGQQHPLIFFHFSNQDAGSSPETRWVARPLKFYLSEGEEAGLLNRHPPLQALYDDYERRISTWQSAVPSWRMHAAAVPTPPLYARLLLAEALRHGMPYTSDPFQEGSRKVALSATLYLLRRSRSKDFKAVLRACRRMLHMLVTPKLLRHTS